jgi:hypothetical protein
MVSPSVSSGFHSSYYLGLGWGVAEVAWGLVQGWEQLKLYEDVLQEPRVHDEDALEFEGDGLTPIAEQSGMDQGDDSSLLSDRIEQDEAELERKVEILERLRGRRGP